ncbi:hypothetical protein QR680_009205 [Steinernema hermaphroditum]|uniref:Cytosolic Fe-S cluster assembly factor NUBP1 homolog n=1 Tax=Steinernema hermaphroditum TaxID=289476 RepID=A0AA39ILT1_9BILA|nr:hypothetical protein QR680_009205 [Steinernema hermaphroditum]
MACTSAPGVSGAGSSKLLVNRRRQNGNPVIKYIRNVPYEYVPDIRADFEAGSSCGIFYLTLKWHKLHPGYLETRFTESGNYPLNILLVVVNVEEPRFLLKDLNLFCYRTRWTFVLSYTVEEAAEYIENIKLAENKSAVTALQDSHKRQMQKEAGASKTAGDSRKEQLHSALGFLSSIRSVNSSDAQRLIGTFGSIQNIAKASADDLAMCPGLGPVKAQNIYNFFRTPFLNMSDVPENANVYCPGTASKKAGKASACAGCPNQNACASGATDPRVDPDIPLIVDRLRQVKHKILVLSGKGGVGKSTVTSTLARAFATNSQRQIAVLDIDICGPSQPRMFGVEGESVHNSADGWSPIYVADNLCLMSIGFLFDNRNDAVVWRGPRKNAMITQFLRDVDWGSLDFLLIDTPPGTSDEHISVVQMLLQTGPIDGALIVTTPQEVSLLDVRKEVNFCHKTKVPVIGVVENMSQYVCPCCNHASELFPSTTGGAKAMCQEMGLKLLAQLPMDPRIAKSLDSGEDFFDTNAESTLAKAYVELAANISDTLDK